MGISGINSGMSGEKWGFWAIICSCEKITVNLGGDGNCWGKLAICREL